MITVKQKGNFNRFEQFCNRALRRDFLNVLAEYGERGIEALRNATPKDSGLTADSWHYGIEAEKGKCKIYFTNSHDVDGVNVAILLIYGHGTRNGAYVQGNDFANPAIRPVFQELADAAWKEVTK